MNDKNLIIGSFPTPAWTLMVEEDSVTGVHVVGLPEVDCDPVRVQLGRT